MKTFKTISLVLAVTLTMLSGHSADAQSRSENEVATLYRSSAAVENARYHVATFDAQIGKVTGTSFDYNFENCQIAANLFENQRGVLVKYWCEKGFYRK